MNNLKSFKYVADLINSKDDIVEQLQILRKYHHRKGVRKFVDSLLWQNQDCEDEDSRYILFCIIKYYYGLNILEVKPSSVRLYAIEPVKRDSIDIYEDVSDATSFLDLKKEDKVEILNGPFKGLEATVQGVSADFKKVSLIVTLFGKESPITLEDMNKMRKITNAK